MTRVLIFGDGIGVPQLLRHVPSQQVIGIVAASNRPQYHDDLLALASTAQLPLLVQPPPTHAAYATFVSALEGLRPELILVNSYSMILRPEVLALPVLGALNLHGALLPRYRGSNPIQWAILRGERRTGVTLHEMSVGVDQGPIVAQSEVPIYFEDTWLDVRTRLFEAADGLLTARMTSLLAGTWHAEPQDESQAFVMRRRKPEDGRFAWSDPLIHIYNLVRALVAPLPGAFFEGGEEGGRATIDRYLSLSELLALKSGHVSIEYGGFRMQPRSTGSASAATSTELRLSILGPGGATLRGCVDSFDWGRRTAAVSVRGGGIAVETNLADLATKAVAEFATRELGLSANLCTEPLD